MTEKYFILIQIPLKFATEVPIDNKVALVQVMALHPTDDKALLEQVLTQFT